MLLHFGCVMRHFHVQSCQIIRCEVLAGFTEGEVIGLGFDSSKRDEYLVVLLGHAMAKDANFSTAIDELYFFSQNCLSDLNDLLLCIQDIHRWHRAVRSTK